MFSIKDLIDKNGLLRIPEFINVGKIKGSQGLLYRLERVGCNSFDSLTSLKELQIPVTITRFEWCFYDCLNLTAINVDDANPEFCSIDGVLFSKDRRILIAYPNAHAKEYYVPDGVIEIGHFAFKTCRNVEIVHLPDSVSKVGHNAFYQCDSLRTVYLPNRLCELGDATEKANMHSRFIYQGEEYTYAELKEKNFFK